MSSCPGCCSPRSCSRYSLNAPRRAPARRPRPSPRRDDSTTTTTRTTASTSTRTPSSSSPTRRKQRRGCGGEGRAGAGGRQRGGARRGCAPRGVVLARGRGRVGAGHVRQPATGERGVGGWKNKNFRRARGWGELRGSQRLLPECLRTEVLRRARAMRVRLRRVQLPPLLRVLGLRGGRGVPLSSRVPLRGRRLQLLQRRTSGLRVGTAQASAVRVPSQASGAAETAETAETARGSSEAGEAAAAAGIPVATAPARRSDVYAPASGSVPGGSVPRGSVSRSVPGAKPRGWRRARPVSRRPVSRRPTAWTVSRATAGTVSRAAAGTVPAGCRTPQNPGQQTQAGSCSSIPQCNSCLQTSDQSAFVCCCDLECTTWSPNLPNQPPGFLGCCNDYNQVCARQQGRRLRL